MHGIQITFLSEPQCARILLLFLDCFLGSPNLLKALKSYFQRAPTDSPLRMHTVVTLVIAEGVQDFSILPS